MTIEEGIDASMEGLSAGFTFRWLEPAVLRCSLVQIKALPNKGVTRLSLTATRRTENVLPLNVKRITLSVLTQGGGVVQRVKIALGDSLDLPMLRPGHVYRVKVEREA